MRVSMMLGCCQGACRHLGKRRMHDVGGELGHHPGGQGTAHWCQVGRQQLQAGARQLRRQSAPEAATLLSLCWAARSLT
jgi:hypothetical protein